MLTHLFSLQRILFIWTLSNFDFSACAWKYGLLPNANLFVWPVALYILFNQYLAPVLSSKYSTQNVLNFGKKRSHVKLLCL